MSQHNADYLRTQSDLQRGLIPLHNPTSSGHEQAKIDAPKT